MDDRTILIKIAPAAKGRVTVQVIAEGVSQTVGVVTSAFWEGTLRPVWLTGCAVNHIPLVIEE